VGRSSCCGRTPYGRCPSGLPTLRTDFNAVKTIWKEGREGPTRDGREIGTSASWTKTEGRPGRQARSGSKRLTLWRAATDDGRMDLVAKNFDEPDEVVRLPSLLEEVVEVGVVLTRFGGHLNTGRSSSREGSPRAENPHGLPARVPG